MILPPLWQRYDQNAWAWIQAVEVADAQHLENDVRKAMNQLVLDLKSNSLWASITSMTVRMGARTLSGALIDMKNPSTSWTNNNFVSGDYNRTTGLVGDESTKYLDTNYNNDQLAQNDRSMWEYVHTIAGDNTDHYCGAGLVTGGTSDFGFRYDTGTGTLRLRCLGNVTTDAGANVAGFMGMSRSGASAWVSRGGGADQSNTQTSAAPNTKSIFFYATDNTGASNYSDHRGRIGGIGANLSLSTLDTVLTTYVNSIVALGL